MKCDATSNVQFSLETLFLIITALAFYLAALIAAPVLGTVIMAIGVPALVRTVAQTTRELQRGKQIELVEKLEAYFTSLVTTGLAMLASVTTLFCASMLLAATALFASQSTNYLLDFFAAATGVLGCLSCLLIAVPIFHAIYWQTLPPLRRAGR